MRCNVEQAHCLLVVGRCRSRMTTDRPNTELAAAVDHALMLAEGQGAQAAAAFLAAQGARFALTCRVLAEPARRRAQLAPPTAQLPDLLPPAPPADRPAA